ncbi:hypothetical protein Esti_005186 [Eimeria stiedai]
MRPWRLVCRPPCTQTSDLAFSPSSTFSRLFSRLANQRQLNMGKLPASFLGSAYIALGSNFGGPQRLRLLEAALRSLSREVGPIEGCSCLYESLPGYDVDPREKEEHDLFLPLHLNAVVRVRTTDTADPEALLQKLRAIEAAQGRERGPHARRLHRTLDLDLLFIQRSDSTLVEIHSDTLELPHPRLVNRNFVLFPLNDISPDLVHPAENKTIRDLLKLNLERRRETLQRVMSSRDAKRCDSSIICPTYTLDGNLAVPRRCFAAHEQQLWTVRPADAAVEDTLRWIREVEERHKYERNQQRGADEEPQTLEDLMQLKQWLIQEPRHSPRLMGILNVTPDSFSDGGKYFASVEAAVEHARCMYNEGAAMIDVGGEATNPFVENEVSVDAEINRVVPVVQEIKKKGVSPLISVDTRRLPVADAAVAAGATMINDITAGESDEQLPLFIAEKNLPYVLMHSRGTPKTMNSLANYDDVVEEVASHLTQRANRLMQLGLPRWRLVLDPGLGFAKTAQQNLEILKRLADLRAMLPPGIPLLIGHSRKRCLSCFSRSLLIGAAIQEHGQREGKEKEEEMEDRDIAGLAVACWCAQSACVDILRVHNVKQTALVLSMMEHLVRPSTTTDTATPTPPPDRSANISCSQTNENNFP